jgi:hypothetical protein
MTYLASKQRKERSQIGRGHPQRPVAKMAFGTQTKWRPVVPTSPVEACLAASGAAARSTFEEQVGELR